MSIMSIKNAVEKIATSIFKDDDYASDDFNKKSYEYSNSLLQKHNKGTLTTEEEIFFSYLNQDCKKIMSSFEESYSVVATAIIQCIVSASKVINQALPPATTVEMNVQRLGMATYTGHLIYERLKKDVGA